MDNSSVQPIVALLGLPVAGNPSQFMFEQAFLHHGLDWRYLSLEVAPEGLADALRGFAPMGFRGATCTEPHKEAVLSLLDRAGDTAALAGVVNCVVRRDDTLVGENTEGLGAVEALRRRANPAGMPVLLLGAGRMARAVAVELAQRRSGPHHDPQSHRGERG